MACIHALMTNFFALAAPTLLPNPRKQESTRHYKSPRKKNISSTLHSINNETLDLSKKRGLPNIPSRFIVPF